MREIMSIDKDFLTGETRKSSKLKPNSNIQGKVTVSLFEDNNKVREIKTENLVMDWVKAQAYKEIYENAIGLGVSETTHKFSELAKTLILSNCKEEENAQKPFLPLDIVGYANRSEAYSGSDTKKGTYNSAESNTYFDENGNLVSHLVYDFPTHCANGEINSVAWGQDSAAKPPLLEFGNYTFSTSGTSDKRYIDSLLYASSQGYNKLIKREDNGDFYLYYVLSSKLYRRKYNIKQKEALTDEELVIENIGVTGAGGYIYNFGDKIVLVGFDNQTYNIIDIDSKSVDKYTVNVDLNGYYSVWSEGVPISSTHMAALVLKLVSTNTSDKTYKPSILIYNIETGAKEKEIEFDDMEFNTTNANSNTRKIYSDGKYIYFFVKADYDKKGSLYNKSLILNEDFTISNYNYCYGGALSKDNCFLNENDSLFKVLDVSTKFGITQLFPGVSNYVKLPNTVLKTNTNTMKVQYDFVVKPSSVKDFIGYGE